MSHVRLPMPLCAAVADVLSGSHHTLNAIFEAAGAPGPPPNLAHHSKWKTWLLQAGKNPAVDTLALVGDLIGEFMDSSPSMEQTEAQEDKRERLIAALEENGLQYFRGGRVLPRGETPLVSGSGAEQPQEGQRPGSAEELLQIIIRGLPRAMHPLTHRRKGLTPLVMDSEYDIQDLIHSQLRPWIADIRPEEFTPSYAGSTTRMDFLLPTHSLVLEIKRVRDKSHSARIGDELIIDIEHYRRHPQCQRLWCVVYDPLQLLPNPSGLIGDLEGRRSVPDGSVDVRVFVVSSS